MKAFFATLLLLVAHVAVGDELADRLASVPNPRVNGGWIADPAGVIARRSADINQLITTLEHDTTVEIAVVVMPTIGKLVPKDFAVALFQKWGVGKASKDNGVLVLHILDQRRIEIETGYGMEGVLPDAKAHWITEEIAVPFFKKKSFADGNYEVVRALTRVIRHPEMKHAKLVSDLESQPGAVTERLPAIPSHDAIALEYASATDKLLYGPLPALTLLGIGALVYFSISMWFRKQSVGVTPYTRYQVFNSGVARIQYAAALPVAGSAWLLENAHLGTFFLPIPILLTGFIAMYRRRKRVLAALRDEPRICSCGQTMQRLSETEDDTYIKHGNVAEEAIGSVEYDVWKCECGKSDIESYQGKSPATPCPECQYRTYRVTNTRTLHPATTASTGMREVTHTCANCNYTKVDNVVIPIIVKSSSRSSGSSGRSGGSFGGGRSGGGGAGSSY